ncbi:unnamed protein product [Eretmochelys imbricata]
MESGKTPGSAGFPGEFYKVFKEVLVSPLKGTFNTILLGEELLQPMKKATVVILPKDGKDLTLCIFYRSISLLNHGIKILAKIGASQLQSVLSVYINPDQTEFIKDRQISDSIKRVL